MYEAGAVETKIPAVELTCTDTAPVVGTPASQVDCAAGAAPPTAFTAVFRTITPGKAGVPGTLMRPAWPTSCCSSSVAPRTPLCISVRFQTVDCDFVICINAL